jgi:hypothetical protein
MERRTHNAEDALSRLLAGTSLKERKAIARALERFYEIAVNASDETLRQRHVANPDGRRSSARQVAGVPPRKRRDA